MAAEQSSQPEEQCPHQESSGWIIPLVYVVFYPSAFSLWIAGGVQLTRWGLPGVIAWSLSGIGGAMFGVLMVASLLRLPKLARLYEAAPVNGATGVPLTPAEMVIPFLQVAFCLGLVVSGANRSRMERHLPPLLPPGWMIYLPWALAVLMVVAQVYAYVTRDPAAESRRAQEEERRREEALVENKATRAALSQCADELLAHWERRPPGERSVLQLEEAEFKRLDQAACRGIWRLQPEHDSLLAASDLIGRFLQATYAGQPRLQGGGGGMFKKSLVLEWEEAIVLLREVADYLRGTRPLENPRLWEFLGMKPPG